MKKSMTWVLMAGLTSLFLINGQVLANETHGRLPSSADESYSFKTISVVTFKDTVELSGFVDSQAAVDRAGKIARSVDGVTAVKNDLIVK